MSIFDINSYSMENSVSGVYTDLIELKNSIMVSLTSDNYYECIKVAEYLPNITLPIKDYTYWKIFIEDKIQNEIVLDKNGFYDPDLNNLIGKYYFICEESLTEIHKEWGIRHFLDYIFSFENNKVVLSSNCGKYSIELNFDNENPNFLTL